jgi:hypothetical protein
MSGETQTKAEAEEFDPGMDESTPVDLGGATSDPDNYRRMSLPFGSPESAELAIKRFFEGVAQLRQECGIKDACVIVEANCMVRVPVESGTPPDPAAASGTPAPDTEMKWVETVVAARSHVGDSARIVKMLARAYGQERDLQNRMLAELIVGQYGKEQSEITKSELEKDVETANPATAEGILLNTAREVVRSGQYARAYLAESKGAAAESIKAATVAQESAQMAVAATDKAVATLAALNTTLEKIGLVKRADPSASAPDGPPPENPKPVDTPPNVV